MIIMNIRYHRNLIILISQTLKCMIKKDIYVLFILLEYKTGKNVKSSKK